MQPGRFVSLWFLYLGTLLLLNFVLGVAVGELQVGLSMSSLGWLLPGAGTLFIGVDRIRNPEQEEWPAEYGLWMYGAGLFLAGLTGWFLFMVLTDLL